MVTFVLGPAPQGVSQTGPSQGETLFASRCGPTRNHTQDTDQGIRARSIPKGKLKGEKKKVACHVLTVLHFEQLSSDEF